MKTRKNDLNHYFDFSSKEANVLAEGLQEMSFGEFLVEKQSINRFQLFRALQMQDRNPGVRLGECIAALGYLAYSEIENQLATWNGVATFTVS